MHFSVGDVVYLISYPSHRMTVVEVDGFEIACRWFEGAAVKEGTFPMHIIAKEAWSEAVDEQASMQSSGVFVEGAEQHVV